MAFAFSLVDLILHFDTELPIIVHEFGIWTYAILFLILFCETGLVVTPFLPGNSLLFIAGTFAGAGILEIWILLPVLIVAAILGDAVNFRVGWTIGMKAIEWRFSVVREEHLQKTHEYFRKYGGFTLVIARFMPFVRTFTPFLAGVGRMRFSLFLGYNVLGGAIWVCFFLLAGFLFGNFPPVRENFSLIVYAIIGLSLVGLFSMVIRGLRSGKAGGEISDK